MRGYTPELLEATDLGEPVEDGGNVLDDGGTDKIFKQQTQVLCFRSCHGIGASEAWDQLTQPSNQDIRQPLDSLIDQLRLLLILVDLSW